MKSYLFTEGSGPIYDLPVGPEGQVYAPGAGEFIRINEKTYQVTSVLWNFDEPAVYIAAVEEKKD